MRLVIEYNHGYEDNYREQVIPINYESKEKFLDDFKNSWEKVEIKEMYAIDDDFMVGKYKFYHEQHRLETFKDFVKLPPKYLDYEDPDNFTFDIVLPLVYTVDEWFDEVENG